MEDQTTPISWRAMPYRAPVLSAAGVNFGTAESLLADEQEDIFHGIVVRLKAGGALVEVAADEISTITASAVHTDLSPSQVASLPAYRPQRWSHIEWGGLFRHHPQWKQD